MNQQHLKGTLCAAAVLFAGQLSAGGTQLVEPTASNLSAAPGAAVRVGATYTTSDANPALTGLGLRVHFNSAALRWGGWERVLDAGLVAADTEPVADTADYDGDPRTDVYVAAAWASLSGQWPGSLPADLLVARFTAAGSGSTWVSFTASSTASGYGFSGGSAVINVQR